MSSSLPILTIVGATGNQGGSVIDALLKTGKYQLRGLTRNANSDKSQALKERGVEVVAADLNDESSLVKAFEGSTAVFGVTDFFEPFMTQGPQKAFEIEVQQGINIANAAAKTSSLKHFIWSTLPRPEKVSGGKYFVPHMDSKNKVNDHVESLPELRAKTTFLWVGYYGSNWMYPCFTPTLLKTAGKYIHFQTASADTYIPDAGDVRKNVGIFVEATLDQPQLTRGGKTVFVNIRDTTTGGLLEEWSAVTGIPATYLCISVKEYDALWPGFGDEVGVMMKYYEEFGKEAWSGGEIVTREDLGIPDAAFATAKAFVESMPQSFWTQGE